MPIDYRAPSLERQTSLLTRWLPDGRLWKAKHDRTRILGRLVEAMARQINRSAEQIELFVRELDPSKALALLLEHEESVGIPDRCFGRSADLEERRRRVIQKLNRFGDIITREQIEDTLADFGEAIEIVPGTEDNAELLGFPAGPYDADQRKQIKHTVAVRVASDAETFPLDFPIEFATENSSLLECMVDRITPANVELIFFYNQNLSVPFNPEPTSFFGAGEAPFVEESITGIDTFFGTGVAPFVEDEAEVRSSLGGTEAAPFVEDEITAALATNVAPLNALVDLGNTISETSAGSKSFSAGTNRQAIYIQFMRGLADVDRQVSYGNVDMVSRADFRSGTAVDDVRVRIWTLNDAGIASAEDNIFRVAGATSGIRYRAAAGCYQNCDQASPVADSDGDTGEDPSVTGLTTAAGGRVIAATAQSDDNEATVWTGVTELDDIQETVMSYSFGEDPTDGDPLDVAADNSGTDTLDQAMAVITLQPA